MMKKLCFALATLALAAICVICIPLQAGAAEDNTLTYKKVDEKEYWVQSCKKSAAGEIVIPSSYNGLPVTGIGQNAFMDCSEVTRIIIPEGVKTIDYDAFNGCSALTYISLPDTLTQVHDDAFHSCPKLPNTTYDNAIYVGSEKNPYAVLLRRTNTGITQCNIHPDTKAIASSAFGSCDNLTEIVIPRGVLGIGDYAFSFCDNLTAVTIPDTVVSVGYNAFGFCKSLTTAYLPDVVTWCQVWRADVYADPDLYADDVYYDGRKVTDLVIPGNITKVGDFAFGNSQFKSITIAEGVKEIGQSAFSNCTGVTKLTMADSVTTIGKDAFAGCNGLTEVKLGKGVTQIGEGAFYYCKGMTSITIPKGVKSIGAKAFEGCSALISITVPSGVTELGDSAFYKCTALTDVTLPDSITVINRNVFRYCTNLKNVKLGNKVTSLGSYAFGDCTALDTIELPQSLKKIDTNVFENTGLKRIIFRGIQADWIKIEKARSADGKVNKEVFAAEVVCLGLIEPVEPPQPTGGGNTKPTDGDETKPTGGTTPSQESTNGTESTDSAEATNTTDASAPKDETTTATDPVVPSAPVMDNGEDPGEDNGVSWLWISLALMILAGGAAIGFVLWKKYRK